MVMFIDPLLYSGHHGKWSMSIVSFQLHFSPVGYRYQHATHFTDEETEVQKHGLACPSFHNLSSSELWFQGSCWFACFHVKVFLLAKKIPCGKCLKIIMHLIFLFFFHIHTWPNNNNKGHIISVFFFNWLLTYMLHYCHSSLID